MDKDFSIDVQESAYRETSNVQLPLNFITVGEIENDDVKVYIRQDVYKSIERFSSSNTTKELGSILFGDYCEALNNTHVVISEYIEAKHTDASASTLTFTHETWDYVNSEHDKHYPKLRMLGWQHTHPNYGIFLSSYDMFIQENFFNMAFQVAYVVDPIQNMRGFFQWKNGKVEKLNGFYVYDDVGKPIKIEQVKPKTEPITPQNASRKPIVIMLAILAVFVVAASALFVSLNNRLEKQHLQQEELQNIVNEQETSIHALQDTLNGNGQNSGNTAQIEELIEQIKSQQTILDNQEEVLKELGGLFEKTGGHTNLVIFSSYTVQKGDCLSDICFAFGLDYQANIRIVKALNGIEDVNSIYVGQTIILPVAAPTS